MITSLTSFFVMFREGFEAVLLSMLMLGVTKAQGLHLRSLLFGALGGIAGSAVLALALSQFDGMGERFGILLDLLTALTLTYVVIWNAKVSKHVDDHLRQIREHSFWAMLLTITTIYFREGMEIVFMLYGPMTSSPVETTAGIAVGIAAVGLVVWLFNSKILPNIQLSKLFLISNVILAALAAFFYYEVIEYVLESGLL